MAQARNYGDSGLDETESRMTTLGYVGLDRIPVRDFAAGWEEGSVDCQGKIDVKGTRWKISRALAGDWVQLQPVENRILVYYCNTLMRELDFSMQRATIVARCIET
jgi:hypothetical protein